jgi:hypothetical protein
MNLPNFKNVAQKLAVFTNNLPLLVAVIIGLVSGLLFIPTQLMSSGLKERVRQESISKAGQTIKRLTEKPVSPEQVQQEAERQKAHANDANEVALLAEQTTKRELLSYDIFPGPDPNAGFSALVFQIFGQGFRNGIDQLLTRVGGRDCPTDAELQRGLENSASGARSSMRGGFPMMDSARGLSSALYGGYDGYGGSMMNVQRMIIDEMCQDRAKSISVYVNPLDISGYEYWANYTYDVNMVDAVKDCWYHQLAYWVIGDVFDTIGAMNSGHESVLTAPVKRFLRITFTMGLKRAGASGGRFRGFRSRTATPGQKREEADRPPYVLSTSDGLTESCTGRYSQKEGDIDVIHFNAAFVVGAKEVLPFMKELCSAKQHQFKGYPDANEPPQTFKHNQITILESSMKSAGLNDMSHRYYRYGQDNVVELNLICEYIFNKKGYEKIVPESVKKTLAGADQTAKP